MTTPRTRLALICLSVAASVLAQGTALRAARAEEGMWTMDNLPRQQLKQAYNFEPSAEWISRVTQASARLALGCSASFVSADGLVMTNHHCANQCLAELSTGGKNYMENGFHGVAQGQEPKCPAMELDQLHDITDVTQQMDQATAGKQGADYTQAQRAAESRIEQGCIGGDATHWRCDVVTLYHGGRYALYKYKRFQDVRMVFAPEQAVAFFGGDPDNFNFPRYDLDVTFLRAYENGKPAHTQFLPFDVNGPKEGELVFTSGNPGGTDRQLPVAQLRFQHDVQLPFVYGLLNNLDGVLWQYSREGKAQEKEAQEALFGIENSLKVYGGRIEAMSDPALLDEKAKKEAVLQQWIDADPARKQKFGDPFAAIAPAIDAERKLYARFAMIEGIREPLGFMGDLFGYARALVRAAAESQKPDAERLAAFRDSRLPALQAQLASSAPVYPRFEQTMLAFSLVKLRQVLGADDALVHQVLGHESAEALATRLVKGTRLADPAYRMSLYKGGATAIAASTDPMIVLARSIDGESRAVRTRWEDEVEAVERKSSETIAQAIFARDGTGTYPDATFTQRLSYGTVKGWDEKGTPVAPFTTFAGLYKRNTGADPFALPQSWLKAKDKLDLGTKYDYVTTNDIIGGNSGSPVIDRDGHAVGLIFDGNIHSLGGDFFYDPKLNRAVAVDTSALVAALRDVYGNKALADELAHGKL